MRGRETRLHYFRGMDGNLKKKKKYLLFPFFIFGAVGIAVFLLDLFRGPAVGVVHKKETHIPSEEIPVEEKIKEFRGTHFSFSIPESFEEKRHEVSEGDSGNVFERLYLSEGNVDGRKVAVVIEQGTPEGVAGISGVAFRKLDPETYSFERVSIGDREASLFTKSEEVYEVTGFFEEGALVASVSVTSAVLRPEEIKEFFFEAMRSFRFLEKITSSD